MLSQIRIGTQIGYWTVIAEGIKQKGIMFYPCRCRCGTEKWVKASALRAGETLSCGCGKLELMRDAAKVKRYIRSKQETGQMFGYWKVLGLDEEKSDECRAIYYKCRCICGKEKSVRRSTLKYGKSISCGCMSQQIQGKKADSKIQEYVNQDLGKKFGHWEVLALDNTYTTQPSRIRYRCRCVCGKERSVLRTSLIEGRSRSCGCRGIVK